MSNECKGNDLLSNQQQHHCPSCLQLKKNRFRKVSKNLTEYESTQSMDESRDDTSLLQTLEELSIHNRDKDREIEGFVAKVKPLDVKLAKVRYSKKLIQKAKYYWEKKARSLEIMAQNVWDKEIDDGNTTELNSKHADYLKHVIDAVIEAERKCEEQFENSVESDDDGESKDSTLSDVELMLELMRLQLKAIGKTDAGSKELFLKKTTSLPISN